MSMATQNAVGLKDISVSKVRVKGADGQFVIMINLDEAAAFQTPSVLSCSLSVGRRKFQAGLECCKKDIRLLVEF